MIGTLLLCATLSVVDGETIKCNGQNMRDMGDGAPFVSGYDTPEVGRKAECAAERKLGAAASGRMEELLATPGVRIFDSGQRDRWGRPLVSIVLPDGRPIGRILIAERFARKWTPHYRADWC